MPLTVTRDRSFRPRVDDTQSARSAKSHILLPHGRFSLPLRTSTFDSDMYPHNKDTKKKSSLNDKMRGRFEDVRVPGTKQSLDPVGTLKEWQEERALRLGQAAEESLRHGRPRREQVEEPPLLYEILSGKRSSRVGEAIGVPSPRRVRMENAVNELQAELLDDDTAWLKPAHHKEVISNQVEDLEHQGYPHTSTSSSGTWVEPRQSFHPDATSTPTRPDKLPSPSRPIVPLRGVLKRSFIPYNDHSPPHATHYAGHDPELAPQPIHRLDHSPSKQYPTGRHQPRRNVDADSRTLAAFRSPELQVQYNELGYPTASPWSTAQHDQIQSPNVYPALGDHFRTPPTQALPAMPYPVNPPIPRSRSPPSPNEYHTHRSHKRSRRYKRSRPSKSRRMRRGRRYRRNYSSDSSCSSCCSSSAYDSGYDTPSSPSPSPSPVPRLMGVTDGAFANIDKPKPVTPPVKRTPPGRKARYAYQVEPQVPRTPVREDTIPPVQDEVPSTQSTEEGIQEFSDSQEIPNESSHAESQLALVNARASAMMARAEDQQRRQKRVRFDLSTIEEDDEGEEAVNEEVARQQAQVDTQDGPAESTDEDDAGWANENGVGFFADGGERGFNVYRDEY